MVCFPKIAELLSYSSKVCSVGVRGQQKVYMARSQNNKKSSSTSTMVKSDLVCCSQPILTSQLQYCVAQTPRKSFTDFYDDRDADSGAAAASAIKPQRKPSQSKAL